MDAPAQVPLFGTSGKAGAHRLRVTRQRMGLHRHDLFVALRVVIRLKMRRCKLNEKTGF